MKIVKYVFLLLLLAAIALTVFIATQNGSYSVEKQKVINISKPVVYNYLNDYRNWANLNLVKDADTTASYVFSDNPAGAGAFMEWKKNSTSGKIATVNVSENDSISQKAIVDGLESNVTWKFTDTLNSTKITIRLNGSLTFTEKAYALLQGGIHKEFDKNVSKGLDNLQSFLTTELQKYTADVEGIVTKNGAFYIGYSKTGAVEGVSSAAGEHFNKLKKFAASNNLVVTGIPFILYKNFDRQAKTATYTFALPIKEEIYTAAGSEYTGGKLLPFTALKTVLKGDYSHLDKAWKKAASYINEKALEENTRGEYIELHTKTPSQTRRPSQLQTDIYIPIGASEIAPLSPLEAAALSSQAASGTIVQKPAVTASKPASQTFSSGNSNTSNNKGTPSAKPNTSGTTTTPKTSGTPASAKPSASAPKGSTVSSGNTKSATTPTKPKTTVKPAAATTPGDDGLNPPKGR